MKSFWTEETVNRNADEQGFPNPQAYLLFQQKSFEYETDVGWSVGHERGGYVFHPVDEGIPVPAEVDDKTIDAVRRGYEMVRKGFSGYVSYLEVLEFSRLSLKVLMGAVRWMERNGMAKRTVNRMGKGYAFKL